jgi:transposase
MGNNVEEIDADEDDEVLERVAAIDVAKASGKVCVRLPGRQRRITRVFDVAVTTNAIMGLADELAGMSIERTVVESTSDYWRPFFYLLEAKGLVVWLVNARDVKQVPGRPKTDKLDAVWLAKLNERGMLRPSFVPPREIRELRDYTRLRTDLIEERSRHKQRLEKLLEDALIKLSTVATDLFGKMAYGALPGTAVALSATALRGIGSLSAVEPSNSQEHEEVPNGNRRRHRRSPPPTHL